MYDRLTVIEREFLQFKAETRAELDVLIASSQEFAKILRRSLIDDAHKFIEGKAGPRTVDDNHTERWDAFVERIIYEKGCTWFSEQGFPVRCLGLLPKGADSAFQHGCDAAHQLRTLNSDVFGATYLQGLPDDAQSQWVELFRFLEKAR